MFSENLKILRKQKGLSQEALAMRLNVTRQTVSKWEKNLSVPDADMLVRLSEVLEVSVSSLLGGKVEAEGNDNAIAEQLAQIAEQLAIKNRRFKRIIKAIIIIIAAIAAINILLVVLFTAHSDVTTPGESNIVITSDGTD